MQAISALAVKKRLFLLALQGYHKVRFSGTVCRRGFGGHRRLLIETYRCNYNDIINYATRYHRHCSHWIPKPDSCWLTFEITKLPIISKTEFENILQEALFLWNTWYKRLGKGFFNLSKVQTLKFLSLRAFKKQKFVKAYATKLLYDRFALFDTKFTGPLYCEEAQSIGDLSLELTENEALSLIEELKQKKVKPM